MRRQRLVDPMTTVAAVSRQALGVATQAEVDATAGELQRYRDTDEARREAPVVTGSTADGTALASLIAALTKRGLIVDGTETVQDEIVTNTVAADIVNATDLTGQRITLTTVNKTGIAINGGDGLPMLAFLNVTGPPAVKALELTQGTHFGVWSGSDEGLPKFYVTGSNGNTTVDGTLNVAGAVTIAGGLNTPYILNSVQDAADTATNTSTTTYADARDWSVTLPTGTWTVWLVASAAFKHSAANGQIEVRTRIAGTNPPGVTLIREYGTSYSNCTLTNTRTGQSGTIALTLQYRCVTAGTASAINPAMFMIAKRTA